MDGENGMLKSRQTNNPSFGERDRQMSIIEVNNRITKHNGTSADSSTQEISITEELHSQNPSSCSDALIAQDERSMPSSHPVHDTNLKETICTMNIVSGERFEDKVPNSAFFEEYQEVEKPLKSLELAMAELRPLPRLEANVEHSNQKENYEISNEVGQTNDAVSVKVTETISPEDTMKLTLPLETENFGIESNAKDKYKAGVLSVPGNEKYSSQSTATISCKPKILALDTLSPFASGNKNQQTGTIALGMVFEEEPIEPSRSAELVKANTTEGINTIAITSAQSSITRTGQTAKLTKRPLQVHKASSNAPLTLNDKNIGDSGNSTKPSNRSLLSSLNSSISLINQNISSPAKLTVLNKQQLNRRVLSRTDHSIGSNHYQSSEPLASARSRKKCCMLNNATIGNDGQGLSKPSAPNYEKPYSKRELRRALPRKSKFSCHELAMKEAGFEDDSLAERKAQRLKERLARVANSFNPLFCMSQYVATGCVEPSVHVIVTDESSNLGKNQEPEANSIETVAASNLPNKVGEVCDEQDSLEVKDDTGPSRFLLGGVGGEAAGATRRRRPGSARVEYIECKPLSHYLEYVRDNRQEYLNYLKQQQQQNQASRKEKPVATLIKMGRAFELRHQGGIVRSKSGIGTIDVNEADIVDGDASNYAIIMAAKALRPRSADPSKFSKARDKSGGVRRGAESSSRPLSEDRRLSHPEKTSNPPGSSGGVTLHGNKDEEHPKTELEKRKLRAEDWTKSVSTHTLTKARIQSLRELGADDAELTKWWEAFKRCHYLRRNYCET
ncbi:hypothetical protein PoB_005391000 [Plakobranchus ocellatus]|uniref:Uncharacterized protein n=1 Tax=Plakobranchus ocellatus TaxID=259542 RepID=A0AAV4C7K4_9GAST|nr:hypothetical protein PoB_005391000 [Plakobranchus ocellatus]